MRHCGFSDGARTCLAINEPEALDELKMFLASETPMITQYVLRQGEHSISVGAAGVLILPQPQATTTTTTAVITVPVGHAGHPKPPSALKCAEQQVPSKSLLRCLEMLL